MQNIVSDSIGLIHLIASVLALITGLWVLLSSKGTSRHKAIGYLYTACMLVLNITAFMIYRLYGNFGIFHWFAVVSSLTLLAGMYPIIAKSGKNYILTHFSFMYWSVIGLYCALMAEIFSRLPKIVLSETGEPMYVFYKFVGIGVALVMAVGIFVYLKFKPVWTKQFDLNQKNNGH
jgi:uncharacterized membrane protein